VGKDDEEKTKQGQEVTVRASWIRKEEEWGRMMRKKDADARGHLEGFLGQQGNKWGRMMRKEKHRGKRSP